MKPGMVCLSVTCPTFLHLYHDPFPSTDSQNHLLCPSLESRFTSHAFVLRVDASCDSWELGPALWAVLYGWHNDFPSLCSSLERTSNHWKEERDEAIEWSVWRILLILSANHSTMESLAGSLVIITALKTHTFTIVLTRISQLLAHNFSHIKLCEDVYIYIYLFDRTFQLAVRTTTPVARTSLHHHLYPVFRSKQLARAWYGISLTTVFLADGRTKRIGSERVASVTRAACTHHTTCTSCIVFHAR